MKNVLHAAALSMVFVLSTLMLPAQEQVPGKLTHWLTPEEKLRLNEIGKNFVETDPPVAPVRNIAEFDRMQGALVRYPFGIPVSLIKEMAENVMVTTIVASTSQQNTVINTYTQNGVNLNNCNFLIAPTDSYWTRDFGPWFVSDSANNVGIVDFPYNRPRPNDDEIPKLMAEMLGIPWYGMNVIHTGGNYMTDGMNISGSTTLVWEENPTQTHDQVAEKMHNYLGIDTYHVVEDPNGTYIDHIDCWGKFLAPDKILIRRVPSGNSHYADLEAMAAYWAGQTCSYGYNYKVFRVDTPQDQPYTNSVIMNNKVLVPFMNSAWDDSAKATYEAAMPGYEVLGFIAQASTPWESTDALHCRVMGIADIGILYIHHIPLAGNQPCEQPYSINAEVIACSDSAVYADSVLIWYRVNNGVWQHLPMTNTSGQQYHGLIPKQPAGSTVDYYLTAADASGRHETMPLVGAADPFSFNTVYTDLTAVPDTIWIRTFPEPTPFTWLHNYTPDPISLLEVQQNNTMFSNFSWWVDSMTTWTFPYTINPSDSFYIRIAVPIPVNQLPTMDFWKDSLAFISAVDTQYVIIMANQALFGSIGKEKNIPTAKLGTSFPNPVSGSTTIPYTLTSPEAVRLDIFDLNGCHVRTLEDGTRQQGVHRVQWDGADDNGNRVAPGIYFCRLETDTSLDTKRIVVIR